MDNGELQRAERIPLPGDGNRETRNSCQKVNLNRTGQRTVGNVKEWGLEEIQVGDGVGVDWGGG